MQSLPVCLAHTFVGHITCICTAYALLANTGEAEYIINMHLDKKIIKTNIERESSKWTVTLEWEKTNKQNPPGYSLKQKKKLADVRKYSQLTHSKEQNYFQIVLVKQNVHTLP